MTLPYWGEEIIVYVPRKPSIGGNPVPPEVQLDALAAYYHQNPWFLYNGTAKSLDLASIYDAATKKPDVAKTALDLAVDPPPVYEGKWHSVNMDEDRNTRFDLGVTFNDFISFAAAIFNAVALAWDNELFMTELVSFKGEAHSLRKKTISLLDEWLGYKYPWQYDLIVQEDPTAEYHLDPITKKGKWVNTTAPVLMLTLPWMSGATKEKGKPPPAVLETTANKQNPSVAIMGVALYNTDGPGYPFTCG